MSGAELTTDLGRDGRTVRPAAHLWLDDTHHRPDPLGTLGAGLRDRIDQVPPVRPKLADRLELDAAQRLRLDSIADDRSKRLDMALAPLKPALDSIRERARDEIRSMLNPTQRVEFEKVLAEMNNPNKNHDEDN